MGAALISSFSDRNMVPGLITGQNLKPGMCRSTVLWGLCGPAGPRPPALDSGPTRAVKSNRGAQRNSWEPRLSTEEAGETQDTGLAHFPGSGAAPGCP